MRLDDDALLYFYWDAELTFDPAGSSVVLEVDGVQKAATWQGTAVVSGTKWLRTARTDMRFAGSAVTPVAPDVQLTVGRHPAQWLITPTADGQKVPGTSFPIDAK